MLSTITGAVRASAMGWPFEQTLVERRGSHSSSETGTAGETLDLREDTKQRSATGVLRVMAECGWLGIAVLQKDCSWCLAPT
jgi:hypothetical protein